MTRFPILNARPSTLLYHPGRDLALPLLWEILREIYLTPEQCLVELRRILIQEMGNGGRP